MNRIPILLVDDDVDILKVYKKIMEIKGFSVCTVDNSYDAIDIIRKKDISVVVTDIIMPKLDGVGLLEIIKREKPNIEVIMLTAEGSISGAVEAVKKGAFSYLVKPTDIEELISNIKKAEELFATRVENMDLKDDLEMIIPDIRFVGNSEKARNLKEKARLIGDSDSAVLITGESGTGKEVLANLIHRMSKRKNEKFVCVNCSAFNENLIESELFGSEKGAYTGSDRTRKGRFEKADGGTIFFDEIGELSLKMQVKLLRVLQEKNFERVGGEKTIFSDFRLITATNKNLKDEIAKGNFRQDLYYRINIVPLELPPLRERREDIPELINLFIEQLSKETGKKIMPMDDELLEYLVRYNWPGNVRELRNIIERLIVLSDGKNLMACDLPEEMRNCIYTSKDSDGNDTLDLKTVKKEFERNYLIKALRDSMWNVSRASREIGISRKCFYEKIKYYDIEIKEHRGNANEVE